MNQEASGTVLLLLLVYVVLRGSVGTVPLLCFGRIYIVQAAAGGKDLLVKVKS